VSTTSLRTRKKLHATEPLQREGGQRLEATTTKRCSSAGECWNAIPNCGRHRLPINEHQACMASWMRTDRATSSIKGTSESSKRIITLHTRVLPERALIYTQQSAFTQKTKHQSTQPAGCHQNVLKSHQAGRQGLHSIAKLSTNPPSQVYLPTHHRISTLPSLSSIY